MGKAIDITGNKYGRLLALKPHHQNKHGMWHWLFRCDCGEETVVNHQNVRLGLTKSCGCLNKERRIETKTKHNLHDTRFYHIWENIKQRCTNPNASGYKNYGGRGIKLCKNWNLFESFKTDMHETYIAHVFKHGEKNTQIDRTDCNGNYEINNCGWVTLKEQALNKRNSK